MILREFGGAENLHIEDVPTPSPKDGWSVVQLRASALNWHDVLVRRGQYRSPLPHVIGADGAGTRVEDGEEVVILPTLWWGNDESAPSDGWQILGDSQPGTYATYVRVPTECVMPKPKGLSWPEAAALPLVGVTTYRALFTRGGLKSGESLLVLGASGGVSTMAIGLAVGVGAVVTVTSSTSSKLDRARHLGAKNGVLYSESDWVSNAKQMSPKNHGFDVVLDSTGNWRESVKALRPGGRLVTLGASSVEQVTLDVREFYFGQYNLIGTTMGSTQDFIRLLSLVESRTVAPPVIDRIFRLDQAGQAHRHLESGVGFGKIVMMHD